MCLDWVGGAFEVRLAWVCSGCYSSECTKLWLSIEFRALRFERLSRCVWNGIEALLRYFYHEFA